MKECQNRWRDVIELGNEARLTRRERGVPLDVGPDKE